MKHLLIGNGINIQFGGRAYTSEFIMKRIKYRTRLGIYEELFGKSITREELESFFQAFKEEGNALLHGEYDRYVNDPEVVEAIEEFKKRYKRDFNQPHEIMLEDWFLLFQVFYMKHKDLLEEQGLAKVGFQRVVLDAIYNEGRIESIFSGLTKQKKKALKRFFSGYDTIFTLNYDSNVDHLLSQTVYHLHGSFSVLTESENPEYAMGYVRNAEGSTVYTEEMRHCFCNALLDYSGKQKQQKLESNEKLIREVESYPTRYYKDAVLRYQINKLKDTKPLEYKTIMAKIEHPELKIATDYHYADFRNIEGELHIIGMSPNNDSHIIDAIRNNPNLNRIVFYYKSEEDKEMANRVLGKSVVNQKVEDLWKELDLQNPKYNTNMDISMQLGKLHEIFNALSDDDISAEKINEEVNKIPEYETKRLCKLVKEDMDKRNPNHISTDEQGLKEQLASISHIALSEGIYPSVLYVLCVMNFDKYMK